jgi:ubiquinone/menaquinone biosynthesis C-methylase UbiE
MREIQFKKYEGMLPLVKQADINGRVLDVGIGTALFEEFLKGKGIELDVTGVEIDARMMVEAKKRGYEVTAASAESLPFEDNSFDFVVCLDTIHAVEDKSKAVSEMRRVLRPGKLLLLSHYSNTFTRTQVISALENLVHGFTVVGSSVVGQADQEQSVVFLVRKP